MSAHSDKQKCITLAVRVIKGGVKQQDIDDLESALSECQNPVTDRRPTDMDEHLFNVLVMLRMDALSIRVYANRLIREYPSEVQQALEACKK